jgi:hypothetical protein
MKQSTMRVTRIQASTPKRPEHRVVSVTAGFLVLVALSVATVSARAAELSGVRLPDTRGAAGITLVLNGIGLRTYSIFRVPIYVAGLYLEQRSSNADTILRSQGVKLLELRFLHDVGAKDARQAWQEGFDNNCKLPCRLPAGQVAQFLADVPSVRRGESSTFLFTAQGLDIAIDGRAYAHIADPQFAQVVLATFIGPVPPTQALKRGLLGGR